MSLYLFIRVAVVIGVVATLAFGLGLMAGRVAWGRSRQDEVEEDAR